MNKFTKNILIVYSLYAIAVILYFVFLVDSSNVPEIYKGSAADPETFMNERQLTLTYEYSKIKHIVFFLLTPFKWIVLLIILSIGLSSRFRNWAQEVSNYAWLQKVIYVFLFSIATFIIMLPIDYILYQLSKSYGIAASTFSIWMKDQWIDFWLDYVFLVIVTIAIYKLIQKYERKWWLYAWLLSIPFTIFLMFVQPVVIDPLYNDFYPLKDKELEEKILTLASKANIPSDHVMEVNMSEKTNALNAYVTGIGTNARIVLWDTTIQQLEDDEILFVMAHEMAHYVKKHIYVGMALYLIFSFLGLWFASKIWMWVIGKWRKSLSIKNIYDIASLPLLLLIFSMLNFAASPLSNAVSRSMEHAADEYAIELTKDTDAAIRSFQKLTIAGLSEVNPPKIVKWFSYSHPTMLERLVFLQQYNENE